MRRRRFRSRPGARAPRTCIRSVHPNPASGGPVRIDWELGRPGLIRLAIYDVAGRLVRELETRGETPGAWESTWDGRDENGLRVAGGVYFAKLVADGHVDAAKMIILR